jgi:predicted porin
MAPVAALADDPAPMFSFGGFGTLGVVHSSQHSADFTSSSAEALGAGYTHDWSAAVQSIIGAQVAANLTPKLSAVLQVISQQNYDASFRPHVEWANLKYQFTPDFSLRVGRTALGLFFVADSRNIGFANPWVRPPIELYSMVSVTSSNGIDASYRLHMGAASDTFQVTVGRADYKYPVPNSNASGDAKIKNQISLVDTYERGFATLRLSYDRAHVTIPAFTPLFDAFSEFGPEGIGIADRYNINDRLINYYGISANYDPGAWFVMAEWGRVDSHSILGDTKGWYVSGGYRVGKVTPFVTYAQVRPDSNTFDPGLNLSNLPPYLAAPAAALNAALNATLSKVASQRTVSAGARWDVIKNVDLKLQLDHTNLGANSQGFLTNTQPGFRRGTGFDLINLTVDFVF